MDGHTLYRRHNLVCHMGELMWSMQPPRNKDDILEMDMVNMSVVSRCFLSKSTTS